MSAFTQIALAIAIASGGGGGGSAPTLLSNGKKSNGGTVVTDATAFTAGSTVCVGVNSQTGNAPSSVTDTAGNTYTQQGTTQDCGQGSSVSLYIATNITGNAANQITVAGTVDATVIWLEWGTVAASSPYDSASRAQSGGTAGGPYTNTTNTLAQARSVVVTFIGVSSSVPTFTDSTTGFTAGPVETNGAAYWAMASFYKQVNATTAVACTITCTGVSDRGMISFAIKGN